MRQPSEPSEPAGIFLAVAEVLSTCFLCHLGLHYYKNVTRSRGKRTTKRKNVTPGPPNNGDEQIAP